MDVRFSFAHHVQALRLLLIGGALCVATSLSAQEYLTSVGLRVGLPAGLSAKRLIDGGKFGLEAIVGGDFQKHLTITPLFTYQDYLGRRSNWYAGGGVTGLFDRNAPSIGVNLVGGIEWTFQNYPVNVALDYLPGFYFEGREIKWYQVGLSVRYILP